MPEVVGTLALHPLRLHSDCQLPTRVFYSDTSGHTEIHQYTARAFMRSRRFLSKYHVVMVWVNDIANRWTYSSEGNSIPLR